MAIRFILMGQNISSAAEAARDIAKIEARHATIMYPAGPRRLETFGFFDNKHAKLRTLATQEERGGSATERSTEDDYVVAGWIV